MNRKICSIAALLVALVLALAACGPRQAEPAPTEVPPTAAPTEAPAPTESPTEAAPEAGSSLTAEALANMKYLSEFGEDGSVTLENGEYSVPAAPGSASMNTVMLLPEHTAMGELNGQPAAAVILASSGGGSGTFINLSVVVEQDGKPVNVATTQLGDRAQINSVTIQDNQIVVDMVTHGPDDAMCCPTQQVVNTYELQGDQLVEVSSEVVGTVGAEQPSAETPALEGTSWQLVSYVSADNETVAAVPDVDATIMFQDGSVSGSSGCNSFSGGYTVDGNQISMGEMATTLMACPEPLMLQEQGLTAALGGAATYAIEGDTLQLIDADGNVLATFVPAVQATLVGPTWSATGYNNGRGGFTSLIIGSEITAVFGEDGTLSGNASCNNYTASYTVDGDAIQIGPAASTRMMCNEPEGIMQQEQEYLAALETAAVYRLDGDMLDMRTSEGSRVAAYRTGPHADEAAGVCDEPVLGNIEYIAQGVDAPVQFQDGKYEDEPNRVVAEIMPDSITCGDVTGDGEDDAVVLVWSNTGGSGIFINMAVVTAESGAPVNIATTLLGDRVNVNSITIDNTQIVVDMITQGPDDPMCCPTQQVVNTYELQGDQLVEVSSEIIEGLTPEKLANMEYKVEETQNGVATLTNGVYEEPAAPDSATMTTVTLLPESVAFGEIDGTPSAAVVLVAQPGGSGSFYYLALVQEQDGKPVHVSSTLLGDRAVLNSVTIQDNQIVVDMVTQGPDDPMCCPSTRVVNTYALQDGQLVEVSSEVMGRQEAAGDSLVGPVWQWQGSKYNNDTEAVPADAAQYTIQFNDDGTVAVKADCNNGSGSYTTDGSSILIEIMTTTLAACAEDSLEQAYLQDLAAAAIFSSRTPASILICRWTPARCNSRSSAWRCFQVNSNGVTQACVTPLLFCIAGNVCRVRAREAVASADLLSRVQFNFGAHGFPPARE